MDHLRTFDVFSGDVEKGAVWVCAVNGLAAAKERMESIAARKPGKYFIFKADTQEVVARTETCKATERAGRGLIRGLTRKALAWAARTHRRVSESRS